MKKYYAVLLAGSILLTACSDTIPPYEAPAVSGVSTIEPVGDVLSGQSYAGEEAVAEEVLESFSSEDGKCRIEKKQSYYEVYLDYTDGDFYKTGKAYAETLGKAGVDFGEVLEPYLYENIKMAFPNLNGDYHPVEDRIGELFPGIPEEYRQELEGFAESLSGGKRGMESDGFLSYEEAILMHMVPDCLRGTNCNAFSVWGEKSVGGDRIVSRTLEWSLGSENQMCTAHAVTHFIMGEGKNSYTTFSVLGMLDMLTGLNDKGVFAGILDAGSGDDYICEGKKCYTFDLRLALETMDTARSVGEYMVGESKNFTFSHNVIITDRNDSFVAEDCVNLQDEEASKSTLRDQYTPLTDDIRWDNPDSLCVVNAFVTEGSDDHFTAAANNYVRFCKYNAWAGEKEKLSLADVKDLVTRERTDRSAGFQKLYSENVFHIIVFDHSTGELEVCFTGTEGVKDHPIFVKIENTLQ